VWEIQATRESWGPRCENKDNPISLCLIRVLLINTNSMVYICYIKYPGKVGICVLAVRDDELDVGDDVAASSGVAARGNARETHADGLSNGP